MQPYLHDGDHVVVFRYWPKRRFHKGQVVICHPDTAESQTSSIKRIVGLPNEHITVQLTGLEQKSMPINLLLKEYGETGRRVWHIPPGYCFVQGDSFGRDSKYWGPIPLQNIEGLVVLKLKKISN